MKKEQRTFGYISDGYGTRYLIFWIYFVLGDLNDASTYLRWYEKTFNDDTGEPIQKLCLSLLLHRMGKDEKAKYILANLMLSNLYIIPVIIGKPIKPYPIQFGSNHADHEYSQAIPCEILNAITDDDKNWMKALYESLAFHRYRKRHIEIHEQLQKTHGEEQRSPLVNEAGNLLNELKKHCR
ncbi:MAG: hypothetical protein HQM07_04510 [Zetaproteobacteria bacterium]|nr:hypothetical protein [Zetaproteobacteria bacterium]